MTPSLHHLKQPAACLRLINDGHHDSAFNMAADEELLFRQEAKKNPDPILRLYRFSKPTLTVGYGAFRRAQPKTPPGLPVTRRVTGGGIVQHGSDLVFALIAPIFISPFLARARKSYRLIHETLRKTLVDLDVRTELFVPTDAERNGAGHRGELTPRAVGTRATSSYCFDSPTAFDLMIAGKKVAGGGQKRSRGYLLHQGSISWDELTKHASHLSEERFRYQYADRMAEQFGVAVKEIGFSAEELEDIETRVFMAERK